MLVRAPRRLQAAVATAVIASFASWQPLMMANTSALHPHAGHASHAHGSPGTPGAPRAPGPPAGPTTPPHHAPPPQCCDLCPVACAATLAVPGTAPRAATLALIRVARSALKRAPAHARARPHELPFPLGPPTLRLA